MMMHSFPFLEFKTFHNNLLKPTLDGKRHLDHNNKCDAFADCLKVYIVMKLFVSPVLIMSCLLERWTLFFSRSVSSLLIKRMTSHAWWVQRTFWWDKRVVMNLVANQIFACILGFLCALFHTENNSNLIFFSCYIGNRFGVCYKWLERRPSS